MVTLTSNYFAPPKDRLITVFFRFAAFYATALLLLFVLLRLPTGDFSIRFSDFSLLILIQIASHILIFASIFLTGFREGTLTLKTGILHTHALEIAQKWIEYYKFSEVYRDEKEIHYRYTPNRLFRFLIAQPHETLIMRNLGDAIEIQGNSRHIAYMDNKLRWDARIQPVLKMK
jgi:hypothetical protein